jgi:hypothetical protein
MYAIEKETIRGNIKITPKESLHYYILKQHKTYPGEGY